ncbi:MULTISPECIES: phosphoadenylyl-sulfate reductase [Actinoalloteichus]|uniref:Adenosine 5'-phosphosulfate reductase n=1 Tax=Actinoalloteichus fjordicus TaxID=1612552 RepID=A0AAC9LFV1_9PSEU|nr:MULTISPECIES: phosphoadenylyl-sulfate reductase [Actinoalloteichus]APU16921.1 thioredoxin-dependent phosophoadenylyl-sulfate reductase [Actinoalloteichus fjordicus]APU23001.1 thioredoxin-dependent phosophoadenylyl-sulfate reductase [Actinoalloteichus sp. GBA129-24]
MSVETERRIEQGRRLAAEGAELLAGSGGGAGAEATAAEALAWTARTFGAEWIVASNMQDAVLIDLATRARPGVDVLFLETGYHFAETLGTRDAVASVYPLRIVEATASRTVAEQDADEGPRLFASNPDRCCALRKVEPLRRTLAGYRAWVTGVRRVEAPTRANTPLVTFDERHGLVKVNPLAAWSDDDMAHYIEENGVLVNPLVSAGYPSIGCQPCTSRPAPGADPRSGRWAGSTKTECGLHG